MSAIVIDLYPIKRATKIPACVSILEIIVTNFKKINPSLALIIELYIPNGKDTIKLINRIKNIILNFDVSSAVNPF